MGISDRAGPNAAITAARARVAVPAPMRDERQPRVTPTAGTTVSASTASTADARNAVSTSTAAPVVILPILLSQLIVLRSTFSRLDR
jgi:hypothetical protein